MYKKSIFAGSKYNPSELNTSYFISYTDYLMDIWNQKIVLPSVLRHEILKSIPLMAIILRDVIQPSLLPLIIIILDVWFPIIFLVAPSPN